VIVPDDQLSLAIGKEGQNARLAARLTGWRVDIRSETDFAKEEAELGFEEEDVAGRCAAIMSTGRRCPNAALPSSRYCGLPAHQALEGTGSDQVGGGEDGSDEAEVQEAVVQEEVPDEQPAAAEQTAAPDEPEPAEEPEAEEEPAEPVAEAEPAAATDGDTAVEETEAADERETAEERAS
jgi:N utilization substance protein A